MGRGADALIVGSGPVGIAAATRLAEQGLRVSVLEAGSAITDPPGSHFRNQARFQSSPDTYFAALAPLLSPLNDDAGDGALPAVADSALVGGQGVLWTNNCPRAGAAELWDALTPAEWERHFAAAEALLQVVADPTADSRTGGSVCERLEPGLAGQERTIRGLPLSGRVAPDGAIHFIAPSDMLEAASQAVRERISVRAGAEVRRLLHRGGRPSGAEVAGSAGAIEVIEAPIVLVAGGALATPRLLHRSGIRPEALGRGLFFHALLFGQVVLKPGIGAAIGETDIAPRLWIAPTPEAPWHIQVLRDTSPLVATQAVQNPHRLLEFQAFLPIEPRDENALVMAEDGRAGCRFAFSPADRERMRAMEADVDRLASELGAWRGGCEPAWVPHGAAHLMGTCRMDRPGWAGVTDATGRVHGFENLYLATVGLIPTRVSVNPTLTAVALASRTCEAICS